MTRTQSSAPDPRSPQIRCYHCQGIFTTAAARQPQLHHVRCPYCSTINGVPAQNNAGPIAALNAAMTNAGGDLSPAAMQRQEQLLRRLQAREITPLELLILREFVEHLQHNRSGATARDIENNTALWTVDDVTKLPEELRTCCVCLDDVDPGSKVRCARARALPLPPARMVLPGRRYEEARTGVTRRRGVGASPTLRPRPARSQVRTLPCLHTFHAECVEEWLKKKKVCPLCQFSIDPSDAEADAGAAEGGAAEGGAAEGGASSAVAA